MLDYVNGKGVKPCINSDKYPVEAFDATYLEEIYRETEYSQYNIKVKWLTKKDF